MNTLLVNLAYGDIMKRGHSLFRRYTSKDVLDHYRVGVHVAASPLQLAYAHFWAGKAAYQLGDLMAAIGHYECAYEAGTLAVAPRTKVVFLAVIARNLGDAHRMRYNVLWHKEQDNDSNEPRTAQTAFDQACAWYTQSLEILNELYEQGLSAGSYTKQSSVTAAHLATTRRQNAKRNRDKVERHANEVFAEYELVSSFHAVNFCGNPAVEFDCLVELLQALPFKKRLIYRDRLYELTARGSKLREFRGVAVLALLLGPRSLRFELMKIPDE